MNEAILDTDILSEMIRVVNTTGVANASTYRTRFTHFNIAAVTIQEVIEGYTRIQATRQQQKFLDRTAHENIIPFSRATAELAGAIGGELDRLGQPIGLADVMIAATALEHQWELVTGNTRHYQRIQQIGYRLVLINWRD